jgi:hypothetical protein
MAHEVAVRPSIWYRLAQAARMVFWMMMTVLLLYQIFGQRDIA